MSRLVVLLAFVLSCSSRASAQDAPPPVPVAPLPYAPQLAAAQQEYQLRLQLQYLEAQRESILASPQYTKNSLRSSLGFTFGIMGAVASLGVLLAGSVDRDVSRSDLRFLRTLGGVFGAGCIAGFTVGIVSATSRPFHAELEQNAYQRSEVRRDIQRVRSERLAASLELSATRVGLKIKF